MKRISGKSIFYLAFMVVISFGGCYSELSDIKFENLKWSPELGVPLVDSKFTLIELLEANADDIDYTTDSNNTIVLSISDDSLFSQSASDYYSLSDQALDVPPIFLTQDEIEEFNSTGQVTVSRDILVDYPNQGNLDEIIIDQGRVETQVEENFPAIVDLSFSLEDPSNTAFLDYNNEFNYSAGNDPVSTDEYADQINNIGFRFDGDPRLRQIMFSFQISLTKVDQNLVFGGNSIDLEVGFQDLEFEGLYGDLSSQDISTETNTIRTDFLNDNELINDIDYYFENPQFRMIFTNSMGVPIRFDVNNFTTYKNGQQTEQPINNSIELESALEGSATRTETNFDANFKNIINNTPDSVSLQIDGVLDPEDVSNNYVTKDSEIRVGYEINLPLEFSLSGLEINETVSLEGIDPQELQYALFKFTSENSLPIDLNFRADLLDEDSALVMNLFDGKFLAGGTESQPATISDIIRLEDNPDTNSNELDELKGVTRIGIRATVSTTNNGSSVVRITSDASVQFNLAVQAKYNVNL
ncbi:hypothetical protein SAMN05661096_01173 [Marivirga sericea]|uniref:DUF4270 domain-containing protein n=1 Tax=Marivirga sericea TaxID=1028 RepID=A0A1X7J0Y3_9BACT|nr:hypothetical protein [Marivirga sericea]SMG21320.1 hypothetical protein SAMN05661096_01173 [Marivirga sericea]